MVGDEFAFLAFLFLLYFYCLCFAYTRSSFLLHLRFQIDYFAYFCFIALNEFMSFEYVNRRLIRDP